MYNKERVKKFSKFSFFLLLSGIILFVLFYLIGAFILIPIYESIPGKSSLGIFLSIFTMYLPIILFVGALISSFLNFFIHNPHNRSLSISHLFLVLSILVVIFTLGFGFLMSIISPVLLLLSIILHLPLPLISIIHANKAKKEMNEWTYQYFFILILCSLSILVAIIVYGYAILVHLLDFPFSM